ncbi:MAG TPA: hypothetical protein VNZ66_08080 [Aeromicrobium sp.]|nr:hypothetical protein [Aeromicrobium sp.]
MSTLRSRTPLVLLYVGLVLTVAVGVVPFIARDAIADHVSSGYPAYSEARVSEAVNLWLVVLTVLGVLGVIGWLSSIWAARRNWYVTWVTSALLVTGAALSLTAALIRDTSGEVGLAPTIGALLLLPCAAGVAAVVLVWKQQFTLDGAGSPLAS